MSNFQLLDDLFERHELISKTSSVSSYYRCVRRDSDGQQVAVKVIDLVKSRFRPEYSMDAMKRESEICTTLKHSHIIPLLTTHNSPTAHYFVYEFMEGADLCFEIVKRATAGFVYSEAVASHYMRQLLDALRYCHDRQIVHANVKPDWVLLANKENSAPVKLGGFSRAMYLPVGTNSLQLNGSRLGPPHFMPPEMFLNDTFSKVGDAWSCGVLLFLLLSGSLPFLGSGEALQLQIIRSLHHMKAQVWEQISDDARDLVFRLLENDPQQRVSVEEALRHPWLAQKGRAPKVHLHDTVEEMKRFNCTRKLKSAVLSTVCSAKWNHTNRQTPPPSSDVKLINGDGNSEVKYSKDEDEEFVQDKMTTRAVSVIMDSLEDMQCLLGSTEKDLQFLRDILDDQRLHALFEVYDHINTQIPHPQPPHMTENAQKFSLEVLQQLQKVADDGGPQANELRHILGSPLLQSLLQTQDLLIHHVYGETASRVTPPPYSSYLNGNELDESEDALPPDDPNVTRVRLVQFQKNSDEPMGITLKLNETGKCLVARIMHGGMIHRQGTLHVGDEIREINNESVVGRSVEYLQKLLKEARGSVTFKIIPSYRSHPMQCEIYVRAMFNYNPDEDDLIPCLQAGIRFKIGDILHIISKDDHNWWQARLYGSNPQTPAGLIPSPELQEWRAATQAMEKARLDSSESAKDSTCAAWLLVGAGKAGRCRRQQRDKYRAKHAAVFDQLDLMTYEEVVQLPLYRRKTLVLLGAHGVGRRHIKNCLIQGSPERFAYPIPHTTRVPRKDEQNGKNYYFVTYEEMMQDITNNEYLEYGTHEEAMYGTKLDTIRRIHTGNLMAILDVEPQALKVLRTAEFAPFVVFIAAPSLATMTDLYNLNAGQEGSLERLVRESELLEQHYSHYFDLKIVNDDIEDTIHQLKQAIDEVQSTPQWIPVTWVY